MAIISTYTKDTALSADDILIGSDADNSLVTANFALSAIRDFTLEDVDWATLDGNPWSLIDVEGTDDGIEFSHNGDIFFITHNTNTSIENDDTIGHWYQRFQSDSDNVVNGIGIRGEVKSTADGDEDASLYINAVVDGTEDTELASFHKGTSRIQSALEINNSTDAQTIVLEVNGKVKNADSSTTDLFRVNQGNADSDAHIDLDVPSKFQSYTTTERDNITGASAGWTIYNETTGVLEIYNGTSWDTVGSPTLTASSLVVTDADGQLTTSDITLTELGYLDGVTGNIQTQIGNISEFEPENTGSTGQVLQKTATGYAYADADEASYTLPIATSTTLGGVVVPLSSDIDIDASGNLTLGNISANKVTNGTFSVDRLPNITASKISSETASDGYVLTADGSGGVAWEAVVDNAGHTIWDNGSPANIATNRTYLGFGSPFTITDDSDNDSTNIGLSLQQSDLPNLSAGKITTGVFTADRLSTDTPSNNQILAWKTGNTMEWINLPSGALGNDDFGSGEFQIAEWARGNFTGQIPRARLSDDTPTDGQVLTWDSAGSKLVFEDSSGGTSVVANPGGDDNTALTSITIGDTSYDVSSVTNASDLGAGILPDDVEIGDQNKDSGLKLWSGTQEEYDNLETYDGDTIYITPGNADGDAVTGTHVIRNDGTSFADRTYLNFSDQFVVTDSANTDTTNIDTLIPNLPDVPESASHDNYVLSANNNGYSWGPASRSSSGTWNPSSSNDNVVFTDVAGVYVSLGGLVKFQGRFSVPSNSNDSFFKLSGWGSASHQLYDYSGFPVGTWRKISVSNNEVLEGGQITMEDGSLVFYAYDDLKSPLLFSDLSVERIGVDMNIWNVTFPN